MISSFLMTLAALAVTLGLSMLALRVVRRVLGWGALARGGIPIRLLQRVAVGPRQSVGILRVGERAVVVSIAEGGVHILTELTGDDRTAALAPDARGLERPITRPRWLRVAALLLALTFVTASTAVALPNSPALSQTTHDTAGTLIQTPQFNVQVGSDGDGVRLTGAVGLVVLFGALTLLPALFMLMTSFTRILIVLHFVRAAVGTATAPPTQLLVVIAVVLTGMVMRPVLDEANEVALQPYLRGELTQESAYRQALAPFRQFMLRNTRTEELAVFTDLTGTAGVETFDDIPIATIASSFIVSELKIAFQMGFLVYLPFIVVDLVVAAILMSMGMFMLPPVMISLPFKLMLFVLADGWTLVVQNLVAGFVT